jgi:hypothetical protein
MIVGYLVHGQDNDSYMLNEKNAGDITCPTCGFLLNFGFHNPFFRLRRKTFDFSHTYDIGHIVSLKFKEFCIRQGYEGIVFKEFEREPNFFQLIVDKVVEFDTVKAQTEFGKKCETCNNFEYTVGFEPSHLKNIMAPLEEGVYRTNVLFGSYNRKNPIIIIGISTFEKLRKEKMKGLIFDPVYN